MKVRPNREMKELLGEIKRAEDLANDRHYEQARDILLRARSVARTQGLPYGRIAWTLCVCLDYLGHVEEALRMGVEAIDQDPLVPDFRRSFLVVARRLRDIVAASEIGDPATPAHYALLTENDAAENDTHVCMARHLVAAGDATAAAKILEAVTTLSPNSGDAWRLRAEIARSQGLNEAAIGFEFEALAVENAVNAAVETRLVLG